MKEFTNECSTEIGSVTQAMRAQDALSAAAIPSRVTKTQSSSGRGCVYAVSYSCAQERNVVTVLAKAGIKTKRRDTYDKL